MGIKSTAYTLDKLDTLAREDVEFHLVFQPSQEAPETKFYCTIKTPSGQYPLLKARMGGIRLFSADAARSFGQQVGTRQITILFQREEWLDDWLDQWANSNKGSQKG